MLRYFLIALFVAFGIVASVQTAFGSGGLVGALDEVADAMDGDTTQTPASVDQGESVYDEETGITTTTYTMPDGSRIVRKTDSDGNVIYEAPYAPGATYPSFIREVDPATGAITTTLYSEDGEYVTYDEDDEHQDPGSTTLLSILAGQLRDGSASR